MRKELIAQVLLTVILFYTGLHLYEQQTAVLEGLRPGRDTYDWAGTTFCITAIIVTFFSAYVGYKALPVNKIGGGLLLFLSVLTSCYIITTFCITAIIVTFFSAYVGYKALPVNKIGGGLLLFLSVLTSCYIITVLVSAPNETMQEILFYVKYYIVLGLWLGVYLFFALPKLMPQKEPS